MSQEVIFKERVELDGPDVTCEDIIAACEGSPKEVYIKNTLLTHLPVEIYNPNLIKLCIFDNKHLTGLPEGISKTSIEALYVGGNDLHSLPVDFKETKCQKINISDNERFSDISSLHIETLNFLNVKKTRILADQWLKRKENHGLELYA